MWASAEHQEKTAARYRFGLFEIPRASVPGRKSRWHALAWTLAATAVVIVAFLLGLSLRLAYTPPPRITQIAFSGRVSPGDPLFESFPGTATVESRIYFQEIENGRAVLAQALIADGETDTFTLPDELAAPSLDDISPDGSRLLLRSPSRHRARAGALDCLHNRRHRAANSRHPRA